MGKKDGSFFDKYDMFGTSMPHFNLEGQKKIGTSIGFLLTLCLVLSGLSFGVKQALICWRRERMTIISTTHKNGNYERDIAVNLNEHGFALAFGFRHANNKTALHDPNLVEITVKVTTKNKLLQMSTHDIGFHPCTADDWKLFSEPFKHQRQ